MTAPARIESSARPAPADAPVVLLTGAAGYIGSHTWVALAEAGLRVVGLDNFSNSSPRVLDRLRDLIGQEPAFEQADICELAAVERVFERHAIDAVVHFAAFKAVGESVREPLRYHRNNVGGLLALAEAMQRRGCHRLVFSSSATVYGEPRELPIREDAPLQVTNPYGSTKRIGEDILRDLQQPGSPWAIACLRYFNPVGAHPSGLIGEDPRGTPNNLMPYVAQVAAGRRERLQVFGGDYDTPDGTGVRDYLHVMDLAEGHVAALRHLLAGHGSFTVNLGTGQGYSVLDVVRAYEKASGRPIAYDIVDRRPGDVAACYADATQAHALLGWRTTRDLAAMCADSWRWQLNNPLGYSSE